MPPVSTAVPTALPTSLRVELNQLAYSAGEHMLVVANLSPPFPTGPVDAYVVVQLPSGQYLSLQLDGSIVPGLAPIARQFQPFAVHAPIASYQFTGAEPLGSYTWLSALTRPGTLELITEISQQPFQVMATPPRQITHTTITPAGGQAVLPNVAAITFAPGAFASPTSVAVESTSSAATATVFNETAAIFRPAGRLAYEVRVNTGATPPAGDTVAVGLSVPAALLAAMPANYQFDVFAQVYQDGGMDVHDTFELFAGVYDAATLTLNAVLPMQVFTNQRTADQTWEAILTIAATPGPLNAMTLSMQADQNSIAALLGPQAGTCQATSIACPLGGTDCTAALTQRIPAGWTHHQRHDAPALRCRFRRANGYADQRRGGWRGGAFLLELILWGDDHPPSL